MNTLDRIKGRGFFYQSTDEDALRRAFDAGPVTFYIGFDPSASSLHVGHLVQVMAMTWLTRLGHKPVAVVGGGTMMVGDPTGRDAMRDLLTVEVIEANARALHEQLGRFVDAPLYNNAEWLLPLNYVAFLRDIGSRFSVNRMLSTEGVKQRLERNQGLSFIEFNYPLMQAYDYLELYRRVGCTLQVGGADQWFNIVSGVDLVRRVEGVDVHAATTPLLTTASGAKMGKTAGGAVWLAADRMSPYDFYQYWVNVDDRDVQRFLLLFTTIDDDDCATIAADVREAKRRLAWDVTARVHGVHAANEAAEAAKAAFSGGVSDNMPTWHTPFPVPVVDALAGSGLAKSRSDARRLIEGGGVSVGDAKVGDVKATLDGPCVLWAGKKRAVRIAATPA